MPHRHFKLAMPKTELAFFCTPSTCSFPVSVNYPLSSCLPKPLTGHLSPPRTSIWLLNLIFWRSLHPVILSSSSCPNDCLSPYRHLDYCHSFLTGCIQFCSSPIPSLQCIRDFKTINLVVTLLLKTFQYCLVLALQVKGEPLSWLHGLLWWSHLTTTVSHHPPSSFITYTHVHVHIHSQVSHWIMFSSSPLPPGLCMCCSLYLWCSIHFLPKDETLIHPLSTDTASNPCFSHFHQFWVGCWKQMLLLAESLSLGLTWGFLWQPDHPLT